MSQYSELEQRLLNEFQQELPLSSTPYADIAAQLGVDESTVLSSLQNLKQKNVVSRVGAVIRPNRVGVSTLAAMAVPEAELESIAAIVSGFDEVNHNYERDDEFNLWFVVVAANRKALDKVLENLKLLTGHTVLDLPMIEDYFIDLAFDLRWDS